MGDRPPPLRTPAVAERRPAAVARAKPVAVAARAPVPAARSLRQRLGNLGTQVLATQVVARATAHGGASQGTGGSGQLTLSQPGDAHEREADRMAEIVMRMPAPASTRSNTPRLTSASAGAVIQRRCAECEEESKELKVHRKEAANDTPQVTPPVAASISSLRGGGRPLPASARAFFEPRFGADFSQVRLHTDTRAADTAKSINAKAFTVGRDIAFSAGQYAPESTAGQRLLAHELTHVVQQDGEHMQRARTQAREGAATGRPLSEQGGGPLNFLSAQPELEKEPLNFLSTFGVISREGVLYLERTAGNQATVAFLRRQGPRPNAPTAVASSPPTVQRNFLGDVIRGAGSYIADLGRGAKRTAKGLQVWDSDAMTKIAEENASAFRLFKRLVTGGIDGAKEMVEEALVLATGGFVTLSALPPSIQKQASDKFGKAAEGIVWKIVAKQVGKLIVHKIVKQIAIRVVQKELYKQVAKKLGASAGLSSTGVGIPVAMLGVQGMIEKASGSADRLKSQFPAVYSRLEPKDLHMAWFLVEDHVPDLLKEIHQLAAETIQNATPDGRILVDAGGGNDRVPINAGGGSSGGRVPIRTGGSQGRVPIRSGGGP